jgi:hypothetical protein
LWRPAEPGIRKRRISIGRAALIVWQAIATEIQPIEKTALLWDARPVAKKGR